MDDKFELKLKYDKFAGFFIGDVSQIEKIISFIELDKKEQKLFNEALRILKKKRKQIKNASSLKEAGEYVKLKKISKGFDIDEEW